MRTVGVLRIGTNTTTGWSSKARGGGSHPLPDARTSTRASAAAIRRCRPAGGPRRTLDCGFTLVELVAVIVIVGVIVAVALPVLRDLRHDARRASLESLRATMVANMNTARAAWLARGTSAGGTLAINGRAVEVYGEGATDDYGGLTPPGAPTAAGMFRMLGCEAPIPPQYSTVTCEGLPGRLVYVDDGFLGVWDAATTSDFMATGCYVGYYPAVGFDPAWPVGATDAYAGYEVGSNYAFYPQAIAVTRGQTGC